MDDSRSARSIRARAPPLHPGPSAHQRLAAVLDDELDLTDKSVADLENVASLASSHLCAPGRATTQPVEEEQSLLAFDRRLRQ